MSLHETTTTADAVTAPATPPAPPSDGLRVAVVRESLEAYLARPEPSRSVLDRLAKSPAHLRHHVDEGDDKDSDAKRFGRVYHLLVLEPELEGERIVVYDGKRDNRIKEWVEFQAKHAGKEIVRSSELEKARAMALRLSLEAVAKDLDGALREVTVLWIRDGILCKARLDAVDPARRTIWDLKTTNDASPDTFFRTAFYDLGLHRQADWYLDAASAAFGVKFERFVFVAQEKEGSYEPAEYVAFADSDFVARGRAENEANLNLFKACRKTASWPGYGRRHIMLPRGVLS